MAIGLFCALLGTQLPEFAQQYRQRLGGAIDELNRMIADFDNDAAGQSMTRAQGVDRLKNNADDLARQRGAAIEADVARAERLARQRDAFRNAGPLTRLVALIENFDAPTAARAIADYEPAVPITIETFVIGGVFLIWLECDASMRMANSSATARRQTRPGRKPLLTPVTG